MSEEPFLSRWSRLKKAERRPGEEAPLAPPAPARPAATTSPVTATEPAAPAPLPPVESLTAESDFTPFMKPEVDPSTRTQALKTLFQDPRFNVMDGLDVYIDDYSKPDPLPPEWLGMLNQMARLGEYREPEPEDPAKASDAPPSEAAGATAEGEKTQSPEEVGGEEPEPPSPALEDKDLPPPVAESGGAK